MNGVIVVNKEKDMTSRDVVNILCKEFKTKKIGHTGTLDPIATGVLVVCIGRYTKLVDILTCDKKEYIATMKLGINTDTLDITGNVTQKKDYNVTKEEIIKVLNSFIGKQLQEVPKYSAIKIDGKKLYEYARENIEIELPKREIEIYEIELLDFHDDLIEFKVLVSKGTYIRSLIRDIASKLNTYATMTSLIRIKQGDFKIEDSYTIDDIKNNKYKLLEYKDVFKNMETYELNDEEYFKVKNGQRMNNNFNNDLIMYTYKNKCIAIYEKYENSAKIKLMLDIEGRE